MRIVHIHWSLGTGGIETMLPDILNEQSKTDDVSLVIVNDWGEDFIIRKISKNVKVYYLNRHSKSRNPWPIIKLNIILFKIRPDIIHTHAAGAIKLVLYPFGKRVRTIHNTYNTVYEYRKFDALIAISKAVEEFTNNQGYFPFLAENGIVCQNICHERKQPFNDHKLHFIQVSRLDIEQKGQDILIKALSLLLLEYKFCDFVMHFVGVGADENYLKQMVEECGLNKNIIFEGLKSQDWVYSHLCDYDLFIQPSRYEGFGLTVAEAVAAKVPVLVSNIEGPLEIIGGGRLGLTFCNMDEKDCASQIMSFVRNGRKTSLVEDAYRFVVKHYDVSVTAKKYIDVYKTLLKK